MAENVGQFMLNRLADWGVKRIYGYPGDGINGLLGAFHEVGDRVEFTQTAHEEIAAFAACAHAKFTGEVGVCMATSGPGAIHLLNGLYDAKLDHQPVVAIVGQQKRMGLGSHYQQEVDLLSLYKDVANEYVHYLMVPSQAAHLIDCAIRIAKATRSVTCIIVPDDVAEAEHEDPPRAHGAVFSEIGFPNPPRVVPQEEDLHRAAEVLNRQTLEILSTGSPCSIDPGCWTSILLLYGASSYPSLRSRGRWKHDRRRAVVETAL
jgi:pyruvate dehydrogenase (quinone)